MKNLLICLLFMPLFSFSQKQHGYFQLAADIYNYSGGDPMIGGSLELGTKGSVMGVGGGFGLTQFKGASSPYVPLFLDISLYTNQRKVRPILQLKGGYGLLDNHQGVIHQTGGAFINPSLGLLLPVKKRDLIIDVGYLSSEITSKINTGYDQYSSTNAIKGWSISFGARL